MASEAELDRMVIRLMGEGRHYENTLRQSDAATAKFVRSTDGRLRDLRGRFVKTFDLIVKDVGKRMRQIGQSMKSLGMGLSMKLTTPITLAGGLSVGLFSRFDKAMTDSLSIFRAATEEEREAMEELAKGMSFSGRVLQTPKELADSYFFLGSAGKNAAQSMELLRVVADFATAGTFDMSKATDLLTDAQSALGMSFKDPIKDMESMKRLADQLVGANTLANASVEQFSTALTTKAGSSFKAYNIELEQGMALLAAYADQGIKAELAGNAADRLIRLMTKSHAENRKAFEDLGIRIFDEGEFRDFADIIKDIEVAMTGMTTEMKAATLESLGFEARVQQVILPLIGASEKMREYAAALHDVDGIMDKVAQEKMKSFWAQTTQLWNKLKVVAIEVADKFLAPVLLKINKLLTDGAVWWKNLKVEVQKAYIIFLAVAASLGPVIIFFGSLLSTIGFMTIGVGALAGAFASVGPILAGVVIAGGALALAIWKWGNDIKEIVQPAWEALSKLFREDIIPLMQDLWKNTEDLRGALGELIGSTLLTELKVFAGMVTDLAEDVDWLLKRLKEGREEANQGKEATKIATEMIPLVPDMEPGKALEDRRISTPFPSLKDFMDLISPEETGADLGNLPIVGNRERTPQLEDMMREAFFSGNDEEVKRIEKMMNRRATLTGGGAGLSDEAQQRIIDNFFDQAKPVEKAFKDTKKPMTGIVSPGASKSIQAASVGSAEAMDRIIAFRSSGPGEDVQERTATGIEEAVGILTDIRDNTRPESGYSSYPGTSLRRI